MDVTTYDPQAVANAEAQVRHYQDMWNKSRSEARDVILYAHAKVIADDVTAGHTPWHATVEQYRYLRDLPWSGGVAPDLTGHEVTA